MILRISVKAMNWKGALKMSIEQMIEERFVCKEMRRESLPDERGLDVRGRAEQDV